MPTGRSATSTGELLAANMSDIAFRLLLTVWGVGSVLTPDKAVTSLLAVIRKAQDDHSPVAKASSDTVCTVADIVRSVPSICAEVYSELGNCRRESTYQKAFLEELRLRGWEGNTAEIQYPMLEFYKGIPVGKRYADLVVLSNEEKLVFEFKALKKLKPESLKQLQFYMYKLEAQQGFLINFPTAGSFPDDHECEFVTEVLQGSICEIDLESKPHKECDQAVEIIKVTRRFTG